MYFQVVPFTLPFTRPLSGILPLQCSFRKSVRQLVALLSSNGATLMPLMSVSGTTPASSEGHRSELQSLTKLVCRLLLEKNKTAHDPSDLHMLDQHDGDPDSKRNRVRDA